MNNEWMSTFYKIADGNRCGSDQKNNTGGGESGQILGIFWR